MRALLPTSAEDVDVHAFYAAGWVERGGLRMNFVTSADGAASASGLSRGLQTPGDNRIFAALRDLADVVVVGAGTARTEGYKAVRVSPERAESRTRFGLATVLPVAVISRTLHLDPTSGLFAARQARTIVITCARANPAIRMALEAGADVIVCGDRDVDLTAARAALEERGLRRILCEGGPHLFADMVHAAAADELCLSISPLLTGPGSQRISAGEPWRPPVPVELTLTGLLEEDGALFCRYRIPR